MKKELAKVTGLTEIDEHWNFGLVMLSAAVVGTAEAALVRFTTLPRSVVRDTLARMKKGRILAEGTIHADWFGKDGGIAFNLDMAVVVGWMKRARAK